MKSTTMIPLVLLAALACAGTLAARALSADHDHDTAKQAGVASKPDVCVHKAPKTDCFICDPKLREKGRLWCNEHGRYEDRCWICHPEAQDKTRMYCKEHSLYEDECFLCHPELKKKKSASPSGGPVPKPPKDGNSQ